MGRQSPRIARCCASLITEPKVTVNLYCSIDFGGFRMLWLYTPDIFTRTSDRSDPARDLVKSASSINVSGWLYSETSQRLTPFPLAVDPLSTVLSFVALQTDPLSDQ